jgi:hypothetical protein
MQLHATQYRPSPMELGLGIDEQLLHQFSKEPMMLIVSQWDTEMHVAYGNLPLVIHLMTQKALRVRSMTVNIVPNSIVQFAPRNAVRTRTFCNLEADPQPKIRPCWVMTTAKAGRYGSVAFHWVAVPAHCLLIRSQGFGTQFQRAMLNCRSVGRRVSRIGFRFKSRTRRG